MKNAKLFLLTSLLLVASCEDFGNLIQPPSPGYLCWSIGTDPATKALPDLPDTNDFILTVRNAAGKVLYHGSYGDSPAKMEVEPGSYTVSAISGEFSQPAFAMPKYGDEQVIVVPEGKNAAAHLECTLLNCGVTLKISTDFPTAYPDGVMFLKQGSTRLMHAFTEKRIAYFFPGEIQLLLHNDNQDQVLLTRSLAARDILAIKIAVADQSQASGSVSIAVDTTKNWLSQTYTIGGDNSDGGADVSSAITVSDAINHIGEEVWLYGYIVGGDLTANGKSVKTTGITKPSHMAMAARSSVTEKASCVAVELPSGNVRDALNLVDHPELIGTRVYVKGKLTDAYFGTIGLKGTSDYAK
ncbi:MAG: DUF6359 domain-containing protein [Bacteroidales bacterium]|nr:DUF6359 domain-containing protein [Bacteroidales bacterium]